MPAESGSLTQFTRADCEELIGGGFGGPDVERIECIDTKRRGQGHIGGRRSPHARDVNRAYRLVKPQVFGQEARERSGGFVQLTARRPLSNR